MIITMLCPKSVEDVMTNILVYYMNSYTNYTGRYKCFFILKIAAEIEATFPIKCS